MNCPACDLPNRPGANACRRCATPLPPSCHGCGGPVETAGELCPVCRTERIPAALGAEDLFPSPPEETTVVTAAAYELRPRFVGRRNELAQLTAAFDDARELGELSFVAVIGPPGAGKTRLVRELARQAKQQTPSVRCLIANAGPASWPYAGFARVLASRFGLTSSDLPEVAREKVIAGVAEVLPPAKVVEVAHLLAHLLRLEVPGSPILEPLAEAPQQLEARTYIAIKRFLAADAARGPLVICLDELEGAGHETINLLHYLAAGLASSPVTLLAVARPSLLEVHPTFGLGETPLERIDVGPLDEYEAENLLLELLRAAGDPPRPLVEHVKKLDRLPRTLFELVRLLLEAEVVVRAGSMPGGREDELDPSRAWTFDTARLARLALPEAHADILSQRLRRMAPADRELLEKAAVIGESFWLDAVVALVRVGTLAGTDPDGPGLAEIAAAGDKARVAVARGLSKLAEREWIVDARESQIPGEREYRFAYPPLRDVVYDAIDEATRRRCHRMVAQWLELRPEGRGEEAQEEVGRHLERAGDGEGASARYRRAADAARRRYYNEKAIRLYAQSLACSGEGNQAMRIHLWHDLGSVYELKGDSEAALGAYERMLRLTWVVSSRVKAAVAFNKMGRVWRRKGDLALALEYLERGRELFEQSQDARGIAGSLDDIGQVLWLLGRYDDAHEKITDALERRGKGADKRSIAISLSNLGNLQKDRGRWEEAEGHHREALELRRQAGDRVGVCQSLNNLAVLAFDRGDRDAAHRGWEQALAEAEQIGALPLQALALNNLGELALVEGKPEEARRRLEECIGIAREIDDRRLTSEASRNLALLALGEGDTARARELATRALDVAQSSGLRDYVGRALLALGEVHAGALFDADATEAASNADDYFQRGIEVFRELGNEAELGRGLERFGRHKLEKGQVEEGRAMLEEARALFAKLGMKAGDAVSKVIGEL